MKKEEIKKPITVALEDARKEIALAITKIAQDNNLDYFLLNLVISDIHQEISVKCEQQKIAARENYEKSRKESDKK